jgi:hypothetical protein
MKNRVTEDAMKLKLAVVSVLCMGMIGLISSEAGAERIQANSPAKKDAFDACHAGGGKNVATFNGNHQVTSCIAKDGHGIVCGGKTPEQQRTCDTFREAGEGSHHRGERMARVKRQDKSVVR